MKPAKIFITSFILLINMSIYAQRNFDNVTIETIKLSNNVYMLMGAGGNIGVSVGDDGVFIIDDQFAPLTTKIVTAIKAINDQPIRFLANTHHHGDHTGGNKNMQNLGAVIIAHHNVRQRLEKDSEREGLPVITFNDELNLHINGEQVAIFHTNNAHTDGDALLYFTKSNVLHTGDTYFNGRYPFIDLNSGGSVNGYIEAVKKTLILIDDGTKIIPGHGKLSNKTEYKAFLNMLTTLKENVLEAINQGKTEAEVVSDSSITKTYDDLNYGSGFINSERIRRIFYKSLKE
ncbi:MBL fold metallo-hydrolase [Snuella sedimenti]|uniref:MBL fold metallo-hydrolase n=1 Tax=Snuella sedimenti TaxID=2798802 RepID=A0A8J7J3W4_9FLAO|nr:MBL fold metallo-hydrolase [Snuella sedimenti]MBJ6368003.1 MBL fold metallo-hydrolase [Snuella sedimenti]